MNTTYWLLLDVSVLFGVMLLTGIIIPQILLIAFRKNLFDTPDPRKIHKTEIPRLGGIAFFPSILLVFFLLYGFGIMIGNDVLVSYLLRNIQPICFFSAGVILLYLTGMADDLVGVKYRAKFIVQILSAVFVIIGGLEMDSLHGFLGIYGIHQAIAIPLTVLLIVFITNAINLIDGIDIVFEGEGENEKGIDKKTGKVVIEVSPDFYRPTDVVNLWGDPTKAKAKLGWDPTRKTSFEQLVNLMVDADMAKVAVERAGEHVRTNLAEYLEKGIVK